MPPATPRLGSRTSARPAPTRRTPATRTRTKERIEKAMTIETGVQPATESKIYANPAHRQDFVYLVEVTDGNPNGDPDAGNLPRVDPETMQGLITDVAIKRKVRDWVDATRGGEERYKIYVQSGVYLSDQQERAYSALGLKPASK